MDFFKLKVKEKKQETTDTVTITIDIPEDLRERFVYKQGQYITLRKTDGGQELRRSYSMSSGPLEQRLEITVKKVAGGRVSPWLTDSVQAGDELEVAPPDGRFFNALNPEKRRTYYMFGAGSGITPLLSNIKTVLESEPMSTIFLLYGSRSEENIIFRDVLDQIAQRYNGQFYVEHILSQPKKESGQGGLFGLFKKSTIHWQGKMGRIDPRSVQTFLDDNMAHGPEQDCLYYVCGPGDMADRVKTSLLGRGITEKQIHTEYFLNAGHVPGDIPETGPAGSGNTAVIHLKGERIELVIPEGATVLDALVKAKYDPPYSCTAGACSTCMAKLLDGRVKMDACYALDDDEVKAGYILTCQSRPETPRVEISYDL